MRIRNLNDYIEKTLEFDNMLRRYAITRRGRRRMSPLTFNEVVDRRKGMLYSSNAAARIAFAREAATELLLHVKPSRSTPAFHLTIIPDFGLVKASAIMRRDQRRSGGLKKTVQAVRGFAQKALANTSYIGVIEVAFYTAHPTAVADGPIFSVHAHLLVWDATVDHLQRVEDEINAKHICLLPGRPPALVQSVVKTQRAESVVLYALKPPFDEYRAWRVGRDPIKDVWRQRTRPLRPGHATFVAGALAGLQLSDLAFSAGAASGSTEAMAAAARARLRRAEDKEARRIVELLS